MKWSSNRKPCRWLRSWWWRNLYCSVVAKTRSLQGLLAAEWCLKTYWYSILLRHYCTASRRGLKTRQLHLSPLPVASCILLARQIFAMLMLNTIVQICAASSCVNRKFDFLKIIMNPELLDRKTTDDKDIQHCTSNSPALSLRTGSISVPFMRMALESNRDKNIRCPDFCEFERQMLSNELF